MEKVANTALQIRVKPREKGKHNCRWARNQRMVPGVVYGPQKGNQNILLTEIFVQKHKNPRFESTIFQTQSEEVNLNGLKVMLKDIQWHPSSGRPVHVDLYALDMSASIRINVPVQYEGEPKGVKEEGGLLQIVRNEVVVECKPTEIPEQVSLDISQMTLGSTLHVSRLNFPQGVQVITDSQQALCTISKPKEESVETTPEGDTSSTQENTTQSEKQQSPDKEAKNKS